MGGGTIVEYTGQSNYDSLQAKLEQRFHNGVQFLATYTWAHALDDSYDPLAGGVSDRNANLIPSRTSTRTRHMMYAIESTSMDITSCHLVMAAAIRFPIVGWMRSPVDGRRVSRSLHRLASHSRSLPISLRRPAGHRAPS